MMNKVILTILALAFASLSAEQTSCCPRNAELGIEFLLLKPSVDQLAFVISSTQNNVGDEFFPSGHRYNNNFCYEPAFRITAAAPLCGPCAPEAEVRFTYLAANHRRVISGPYLFDTVGWQGEGAQGPEDTSYDGTANMYNSIVYYGLDTTINSYNPCENLEFFVGLHGAYIKYKTDFHSTGIFDTASPVANNLQAYSSFWGVGPQIGFDYGYCLPFKLNLITSVRAALLCSNTQAHMHYSSLRTIGTAGVNLKNDTLWRVTPTIDARISAEYTTCCCNYETTVEFGYEWIWYHNGIDQIRSLDVAFPGQSIDLHNDLSMQGPYLRLAVGF